jgi:hypothetical protein
VHLHRVLSDAKLTGEKIPADTFTVLTTNIVETTTLLAQTLVDDVAYAKTAAASLQTDSDLLFIRELAKQVEMKVALACVSDATVNSASKTTMKGMRRLPDYEQSKFDVIAQTYQYLDEIITDFKDLALSITPPQYVLQHGEKQAISKEYILQVIDRLFCEEEDMADNNAAKVLVACIESLTKELPYHKGGTSSNLFLPSKKLKQV